jgi:diguanylate cyclase (GGDEF)-like protein/putative nucleotidyltransferase with HDIG domain
MRPEVQAELSQALPRLLPLPVLSGTAARVRALAAGDDASTDQLVEAIEGDEAFALNLLRFANSSAVRPLRARSVRHAVTLVGRRAVARLALEAATYRFFADIPGAGRASRGQMHAHAVKVARAASAAAERCHVDAEAAHLAGLLHDVGKLVLPLAFGVEAVDAVVAEAPAGTRRAELERERLGVDHAYAGALLARQAFATAPVTTAIELHHGGRSGQETRDAVTACVQLANAIVAMSEGHEPEQELIHVTLDRLKLPLTAIDELAEQTVAPGPRTAALAARVIELERLAQTDDLTGVSNRRHWLTATKAALERGETGAVLLGDIDHFKRTNDSFGHHAGDLVLIRIAGILRRHGHAGRLGGDELVVWVPGGYEHAYGVASAILADAERELATVVPVPPTLSIGIATAPQHGRDITSLLELADGALYSAKAAGRNRAVAALPR